METWHHEVFKILPRTLLDFSLFRIEVLSDFVDSMNLDAWIRLHTFVQAGSDQYTVQTLSRFDDRLALHQRAIDIREQYASPASSRLAAALGIDSEGALVFGTEYAPVGLKRQRDRLDAMLSQGSASAAPIDDSGGLTSSLSPATLDCGWRSGGGRGEYRVADLEAGSKRRRLGPAPAAEQEEGKEEEGVGRPAGE